jgi:hypothetical protein
LPVADIVQIAIPSPARRKAETFTAWGGSLMKARREGVCMGNKWLPEDNIKRVLGECFHFVESQQNENALLALLTRSDAVTAFEKLKKKVTDEDSFLPAVKAIGQAAMRAFHPNEDKLTASENRESCEEAAKLAKRLSVLIAQNSNLRPPLEAAVSPVKRAALERILQGVLLQNLSFTEEVESKINAVGDLVNQTVSLDDGDSFEVEYSDDERLVHDYYKGIDTATAYKILRGYAERKDDLQSRLKLFETEAMRAVGCEPIASRSKSDNVDIRIFSIALCRAFDGYCGSPNYELVADFALIIFDKSVESDTIKKWLKRDRDNSTS